MATKVSSELVTFDQGSVRDVLDKVKSLSDYTQLRSYNGRATHIRITDPGIAGFFYYDASDTTSVDNGGTVIVSGSKRWKRVVDDVFVDSWWQPAKNGISDDGLIYQNIAAILPASATLKVVGNGTRIIGNQITFSQSNLTFICDKGAKFKQKNNTLTLDSLFHFSGSAITLLRMDVDGNVAGNITTSYTGRGEIVKVSGDNARIEDFTIRNTHVKDFACGLYITGKDSSVTGVLGDNTGRIAIRDRGDRTTIKNVRCLNIATSSPDIGNRVIGKDGSSEASITPFTWVNYENIYGHSTSNSFISLIVVDDALNIGGVVRCNNLFADFPSANGPDVIKFVNCRRVDIDGLTTYHAGNNSSNASLRFQENVGEVNLSNLDLAGHINYDTTTYCKTTISGSSVIGRDLSGPVCIDDHPDGYLVIGDGCVMKNFTQYVIATYAANLTTNAANTVISIGQCVFNGSVTGDASLRSIVNYRAYALSGTKRRLPVGLIRIENPIQISNTRTFLTNARWVALNDAQDSACVQGNDGRFLVSGTGFTANGPNGVEGWKRGMEFYRRDPVAGATPYVFVCTTSGASCTDMWAGEIEYTLGQWRVNGANVYACATPGTSASTGGPTGTGTGIVDGTCVWDFVDVRAVFKPVGSIGA
jgi:hypothetical protein